MAPPALGRGKRVAAGGETGSRALLGWLLCRLFLLLPARLEQALGASGSDSALTGSSALSGGIYNGNMGQGIRAWAAALLGLLMLFVNRPLATDFR